MSPSKYCRRCEDLQNIFSETRFLLVSALKYSSTSSGMPMIVNGVLHSKCGLSFFPVLHIQQEFLRTLKNSKEKFSQTLHILSSGMNDCKHESSELLGKNSVCEQDLNRT